MRDNLGRFIKNHKVPKKWRDKFRIYIIGRKPMIGKKHSEKTKLKISHSRCGKAIGEDNGNWKGGISRVYKTGYYSTAYKKWRKAVFKKDNYTCQKCGLHGSEGYLTPHHIKSFSEYPKLRYNVNNGMTLCEDCHKLTDNYKGRNRR